MKYIFILPLRSAFMLVCIGFLHGIVLAQTPVELSLGKGHKAIFTPPKGWTKGTGYGNEQCWNAPDNSARVCLKTTWKRGRTADRILKESVEGLNCIRAEDKQFEDDHIRTVWKECEVKVGPRTEGRLWSVTDFKEASDALSIEVQFIQAGKSAHRAVLNSIEGIKYLSP